MSSLVFRSNQCSASLNADFTLLYFTLLCRFYKFLKNSNNFQMSTYIVTGNYSGFWKKNSQCLITCPLDLFLSYLFMPPKYSYHIDTLKIIECSNVNINKLVMMIMFRSMESMIHWLISWIFELKAYIKPAFLDVLGWFQIIYDFGLDFKRFRCHQLPNKHQAYTNVNEIVKKKKYSQLVIW
ncbi:hypothetical protein DERF_008633 [Dermatophagoides farinae]|uniref:Uncharacterized protein n=1 Tax=Dermatophagoides farinae TaxID=6954 RepID=A0A922I0S5_DERFA|nr:hypothetical protein DERF_008633 [Dermatophagoides farinae]